MSGNSLRTSRISHSQKPHRLRVRVVDAEDPHPALAPAEHDRAQLLPEPAPVLRIEVDVVDVLILLGRVLRVLERSVGPPVEPFGMRDEPRMVGRALDRQVERDLDARLPAGRDHRVEVLPRPELGMDRLVAALGAADRPRASGIAFLRDERVVPTLPVRRPDRVHGGQVDDVEAELRQRRQHRGDAAEPAPRARKELVPGAEAGALTLDVDLERASQRRLSVPILRAERRRGLAPLGELAPTEEHLALRELAREVELPRLELPVELVERSSHSDRPKPRP